MFCIYTSTISRRFEYIAKFIFGEVLGLPFIIIDKKNSPEATTIHLNYSNEEIKNSWQIKPHTILFEENIVPQKIEIRQWNNMPIFFLNQDQDLPFDIFAASFYLLTRYEEYLPYTPDEHSRFKHQDSLAFNNNFLQLPLINIWCEGLKKVLVQKHNSLNFEHKKFQHIPTYDVDIAFQKRTATQNTVGIFKQLITGNWKNLGKRIAGQKDLYNVFEEIENIDTTKNLNPIYFFLVGKPSKYNRNPQLKNEQYASLIKTIFKKYNTIGIHPGYESFLNQAILNQEKTDMEKTIEKEIKISRQHYIRFKLPDTYNQLLDLGFEQEYSMGYGEINGFRASTCNSFFWFDLTKNKVRNLRIFPFCYMDSTDYYNHKLNATDAFKNFNRFYNICKQYNGLFIPIFHNHILGEDKSYLNAYKGF